MASLAKLARLGAEALRPQFIGTIHMLHMLHMRESQDVGKAVRFAQAYTHLRRSPTLLRRFRCVAPLTDIHCSLTFPHSHLLTRVIAIVAFAHQVVCGGRQPSALRIRLSCGKLPFLTAGAIPRGPRRPLGSATFRQPDSLDHLLTHRNPSSSLPKIRFIGRLKLLSIQVNVVAFQLISHLCTLLDVTSTHT
jgi:hypothetical protein